MEVGSGILMLVVHVDIRACAWMTANHQPPYAGNVGNPFGINN